MSDYTEVTWTADSATNTTVGVDVNPIFSPQLAAALTADPDAKVVLTVRQPYLTSTVVTNAGATNVNYCSPQVVVENQLLYAAVLDASQINDEIGDPDANLAGTPAFVANPDQTTIITLRFINPPSGFDDPEMIDSNTGMEIHAQPGTEGSCDAELEDDNVDLIACEIDYIEPDTVPPVVTLIGSDTVTLEAGPAPYTDAGATAQDDRDGVLTPTITSNNVNPAVPGSYQVVWSATDAAMNTGSATRTVNVIDTTSPVIAVLGDNPASVEAGDSYSDPGATATDFVDGDLSSAIATTGSVDTATVGSYTLFYDVADSAGNAAATATRVVNVVDTTPPVITLIGPASLTVEAAVPYVDQGATASDIAAGDLTASIVTVNNVNVSTPGVYTVTYNVTDPSNNAAAEVIRTVTVVDTTAPVISLIGPSPLTVEAGATYVDPGATASDAVDGDLTSSIVVTNNVKPGVAGQYTVIYNVSDSSGNAASPVARQVSVVDTTDPVIVSPTPPVFVPEGPYVLPPGETVLTISWPIAVQDLENGLSVFCTVDGVDVSPTNTSYANGIFTADFSYDFSAGTTTATCSATDQGGNTTTSAPFDVLVEDVPVITVLQPVLTILSDSGGSGSATITNADLAANVAVSDQVDDSSALIVSCSPTGVLNIGSYAANCTVTDSAGNSSSAAFTLDVVYRYTVVFGKIKGNASAGSSVPLDFWFVDSESGLKTDSGGFMPSAVWTGPYTNSQCDVPIPDVPFIEDSDDAGSSDFRYAASRQEWQYSWDTPTGSGHYLFIVSPPGTVEASSVCVRLR